MLRNKLPKAISICFVYIQKMLLSTIKGYISTWWNVFDRKQGLIQWKVRILSNGILLPKLFWPTVRKNCSSDREKLLKFEAVGREFAKNLRSLEQFIQTVKGQNNFW